MSGRPCCEQPRPLPRGLTLVELLAVVGIVAMVAALLVPTIGNAMRSARTAAIRAEIDMLHTAMMNYRSEYGELPPCIDTSYVMGTEDRYKATGEAARHVQRLFPRCVPPYGPAWQLNQLGQRAADPTDAIWKAKLGNLIGTPPFGLVPNTAITAWLAGFSTDPRLPLAIPDPGNPRIGSAAPRVKLFDFDTSRNTAIGQYAPPKKPKSPYIYIDSANYGKLPYITYPLDPAAGVSPSIPGAFCRPLDVAMRPEPSGLTPSELAAWRFSRDPNLSQQEFFNADTFQILCAGLDEQFGTDDDLSNFWPGTRKQYLDSLK